MPNAVKQYESGLEAITLTIANGASLSDAADLKGKCAVGVILPSAWTAAALSFAANNDGGATYYPLYDQTSETSIASTVISTTEARQFALDPAKFLGVRALKARSGLNGAAVNQGAARSVILLVRPL